MTSTTPESEAQAARLDEIIAVSRQLQAVCGSSHLVDRLVHLYGHQQADSEDHILRIVGRACLQHGQRDLWQQIYRAAREGCHVRPGDEMAFLLRRPLDAEVTA